ncbi:hypothetical protein FHG87_020960 [Trinorchestia longiramus]|nr:hypothetical protein FHG87_020960 [Trinorchestia longiramus]
MRSEDSNVILVCPIGMEAYTFTSDPVALAQSIVKLGFAGTQCPSHIYVGFTRYAVFPFNAPPRCHYRCQRLGHVAVNYNSPLRCLVCSGPHSKDECTAEPGQEKCANCHQTHIASSKECPAIRNAAAIQKLQHSGVGFEAAKHKVMKTQIELATKAPFMKKQNLTVPIVSSNIMGSQHSIQGNPNYPRSHGRYSPVRWILPMPNAGPRSKSKSLMDVVHEQCGENKWNARCVEEDPGMRYLVGLDEECNMTVVDAMKDFLMHAWNK